MSYIPSGDLYFSSNNYTPNGSLSFSDLYKIKGYLINHNNVPFQMEVTELNDLQLYNVNLPIDYTFDFTFDNSNNKYLNIVKDGSTVKQFTVTPG